jgi:hypothetical protein
MLPMKDLPDPLQESTLRVMLGQLMKGLGFFPKFEILMDKQMYQD